MFMSTVTAMEIDFLPVGKETKSGDAIAVRYGTPDAWNVMVIDGGDLAAGDDLVAHILKHYGSPTTLAHVVCTHCDADHVSGLRRLFEHFHIQNLWVHQPWRYAGLLNPYFSRNWTDANLATHLRNDCFPFVADLCDLAESYGTTLREPFAGERIGPFSVLAPSGARLLKLIPQMDHTPMEKATALMERAYRQTKARFLNAFETWELETLQDPGTHGTSVANETSVVLYSALGGGVLLTGDAGVGALTDAANTADQLQMKIQRPHVVQIPHHGSRHNVSPAVLNRILGPAYPYKVEPLPHFAYVSCAAKSDMPRKVVENAFMRRGYDIWTTKSGARVHRINYPERPGWTYGGVGSVFNVWVES